MRQSMRRFALLVAVLFAAALICSAFLMGFAAGHSCHHENCQICAVVSLCRFVIKALAAVTALALWGQTALCLGAVCLREFARLPLLPTPVSTKVKLSN